MPDDMDNWADGGETPVPEEAHAELQAAADPVEAEAPAEGDKPVEAEKPGEPQKSAEEEPHEPEDVTGLRSALQAERAKRKDYKGERDRIAGERDAMQKRLDDMQREIETLRKPPPAAEPPRAPAQPPAWPSPAEDPQGYHARLEQEMFNQRLNMSETMLRQHLGNDADVDEKVGLFQRLMEANPALRVELNRQQHPYQFAYDYAKRHQAMEEIGADPAAFRARVIAEERAKWEAEHAGTQQPVAPAQPRPNLPQSLSGARSTGGRTSAAPQIAEDFEDILQLGGRK